MPHSPANSYLNPDAIPPFVTRELRPGILLDSRLALVHRQENWLAVADLHYGFELSQRAAGNLFPMNWGMAQVEQQLLALLDAHQPQTLVLLGDCVHDRAGREPFEALCDRLRQKVEHLIIIAGNHEAGALPRSSTVQSWLTESCFFHHGHQETTPPAGRMEVIGHFHPAGRLKDGAGLSVRLPGLVQGKTRWILPAFSPWSSGTGWDCTKDETLWLCHQRGIFCLRDGQLQQV